MQIGKASIVDSVEPRFWGVSCSAVSITSRRGALCTARYGGGAACEGFSAIVERPTSALMGARMDDLTHPDDAQANGWLLDRALITRQPFVLQKRYVLKGGVSRWVESRYTVLFTAEDNSLVSMPCRAIDNPNAQIGDGLGAAPIAAYLQDMARQMACIARQSNLF